MRKTWYFGDGLDGPGDLTLATTPGTVSPTTIVAAISNDESDRVILRCEWLDTAATITLNGTTIGETDYMFRFYKIDVKTLLKPQANRIPSVNHSISKPTVSPSLPRAPIGLVAPGRGGIRCWTH